MNQPAASAMPRGLEELPGRLIADVPHDRLLSQAVRTACHGIDSPGLRRVDLALQPVPGFFQVAQHVELHDQQASILRPNQARCL
jgi:hypothetical protein